MLKFVLLTMRSPQQQYWMVEVTTLIVKNDLRWILKTNRPSWKFLKNRLVDSCEPIIAILRSNSLRLYQKTPQNMFSIIRQRVLIFYSIIDLLNLRNSRQQVFMAKFLSLTLENTSGHIITAYGPGSFLHKNRLVNPQDQAVAIFMIIIIIWILEIALEGIINTIEKSTWGTSRVHLR